MTTATAPAIEVRAGSRFWADGYTSMLRFETRNLRTYLTIGLVIQLALGAGMTFMYAFYFGDLDSAQITFLVTGIPTLALVPIGFVMVPSAIMEHKLHDTYDYVWSLPVPRLSSAMATFSIFAILGIPGMVVALLIAGVIYDADLAVSWSIVPAVLVSSSIGASVGYALGHVVPEPRVISLITNIVMFLVLLFSPIVVAIEQFPDWWAGVHHVLPFWHMSVVIRAALTDGLVTAPLINSYAVLAVWGVVSGLVAALIVGRRR
jgi:ABC-2 type transport system permease protein